VPPGEVEMVDIGSAQTKSHRRIFHVLGHNAAGRAGNLLVSELYCDEGCWSGYPPHKHDDERPPAETGFEELYHFRFRPENGFGAQLSFQPDGSSQCFMTRNGDTFLLDRGYHPTVTSPGHEEYIFTILVGKHQRSLVQNFKEEYRHIMGNIPGIQDMVDKFK
jgi:5-deoxy-glucuronate isomerase